jgi:predicted transposase YbfD/YdcC
LLHPKKVGAIPVSKNSEEVKQTNEIKVAAPLLDAIEIENKNITADALHTQWKFARYIVEERKAHYYFTVKDNQRNLLADISFYFQSNKNSPQVVLKC